MNLHSALYVKINQKCQELEADCILCVGSFTPLSFLKGRILGCTIIFVRTPTYMNGWIYLHFLC